MPAVGAPPSSRPAQPSNELSRGEVLGRLVQGALTFGVRLRSPSKLGLTASFPEDVELPPADAIFDRVVVESAGREFTLSRCRLSLDPDQPRTGRLIFLDDVYDCQALLNEGRLRNLVGFFQELPLVLGQKEQIRPEFRSYVVDLNYDLCVYKKFFDEQDRAIGAEAPEVAAAAQEVLLSTAGREFFRFMDEQHHKLTELVRDFSPEEHERHGFYFRQQFWPFILGSAFMKRTNLKPRGYAGDATMMQMLYDNAFVGNFVFNKLLHKHPLEQPAAQAVRNRRVLVPQMLRERLAGATARASSAAEPFRVLSVACGPARELEDIFASPDDLERLAITLLDQDEEALTVAKEGLTRIEQRQGRTARVRWVNDSVRTMLKTRDLVARFGQYDFVYSMGLFDYLTPPVARAVLGKLFELLAPGGVAIIGNYHVGNASRFYMAYWCDWSLYYRTEAEMLDLAARLPGAKCSVGFDASGAQMFLRVEREG